MLRLDNLWKQYGSKGKLSGGVGNAQRGLTLTIRQGEIFGLIGPDGAGKSTLIRLLTTLLLPSGGTARIGGYDLVRDYMAIRRQIGYMPQVFSLYSDLSVEENLHFYAAIFDSAVRENYHLIADIYEQLAPFRKRKAGALSGGMKQKLTLCCALIHRPRVLFLDEPTTGVDPVSRVELWSILQHLKQQGVTIVVSTAYMDEASQCDRIALMREGACIGVNTPEGLLASYQGTLYRVEGSNMLKLLRMLRSLPSVRSVVPFGDAHHVTLYADAALEEVRSHLASSVCSDAQMERIVPTVEDCFIALSDAEHG